MMVSDTKSLIGCPPKVLIRWSASWITKTTRIREGMAGVLTPRYIGLLVVLGVGVVVRLSRLLTGLFLKFVVGSRDVAS